MPSKLWLGHAPESSPHPGDEQRGCHAKPGPASLIRRVIDAANAAASGGLVELVGVDDARFDLVSLSRAIQGMRGIVSFVGTEPNGFRPCPGRSRVLLDSMALATPCRRNASVGVDLINVHISLFQQDGRTRSRAAFPASCQSACTVR